MAKNGSKNIATFVNLPDNLRKELREIAKKERRSLSNVLVVAAEQLIERKKQEAAN